MECSNPQCAQHGGRDETRCMQPGCQEPWTVDIERFDGWSSFMCDQHADELLESTPEGVIKSVTGSWGLGPVPAQPMVQAFSGGNHRARRKARRKAERRARRSVACGEARPGRGWLGGRLDQRALR